MIVITENLCFKEIICSLGIPDEKICENVLELFSDTYEFDFLYYEVKLSLLRKKYPLECIREVMLCLDEAYSNAIIWGNKKNAYKKVTAKYYVCKKFCAICIKDQGEGFNVKNLIGYLSGDIKNVSKHVRGLYFIYRYSDKVFLNEKGNKIMMIKENSYRV